MNMRIFYGSKWLVWLLIILPGISYAQFNIAILPTGGIYLKSQLWNISVSNTSSAAVEATLHLDMKDIQTQQTVLSAQTAAFRVGPGMTKPQLSMLEPVIYNYGPGIRADRSSNGTLPIGKYQVCYQLIWKYGENQTATADDCDEIEVEPLSPPVLTLPENDSVVANYHPDFSWVPPAPLSMFSDLRYDLLISEVNEGQAITDAIQQNLPLQQAEGLTQPFFSYPVQGPQLEKGKKYVWQIIARDQTRYAVKSEIWTFRTGDKALIPALTSVVYLVMSSRAGGRETIEPGTLHIKYTSGAPVIGATLQIKSFEGAILYKTTLSLRQGDNFLHVPLNSRFQSKQTYAAFLQLPGGEVVTMSFAIK